jgi:16S rRNA (guanine1207-N2)-methyltransferase
MARKTKGKRVDDTALRVPVAEQLLIDELPAIQEVRILCTTLGRGQFALAAAQRMVQHALPAAPGASATSIAARPTIPDLSPARGEGRTCEVVLHEFDVFLADEARQFIAAESANKDGAGEGSVHVVCAADFPDAEFDLAALPVDPRGEAELTRDLLQSAHLRLRLGGRLLAATSNAEDQWLHGELRKLFAKVTRRPTDRGVLYLATRISPLKKVKRFDCEFAFRNGERLIKAVSRPGVFSHRSLDAGARALVNTMQVTPGARVLDLGCGSGVVSFAAAFRASNVSVTAVDSHARAVECTERGATLNGLTGVTTVLNTNGDCGQEGSFDLVVGNPPYFSDYRIAEIFLQAARRALKPGGTILIVTKAVAWYEERMPALFQDVRRHPHKTYTVFEARTHGR